MLSEGPDAWTVLLDMQVTETFGGQGVKDVFIRYPLRVVRFDVDRERNPGASPWTALAPTVQRA